MSEYAKPKLVIYLSNGFALFCVFFAPFCGLALLFGWLGKIIPYPSSPNSSNTIFWTLEYGLCFLTLFALGLLALRGLVSKLLGMPVLVIDQNGITHRFARAKISWADIDCVWAGRMKASNIGANLNIIGRWQHMPVWPLKGQPKFGKPAERCSVNFIQLSLDGNIVIKAIAAYLADQPGTAVTKADALFDWCRAKLEKN
jgi:hypothetical protein